MHDVHIYIYVHRDVLLSFSCVCDGEDQNENIKTIEQLLDPEGNIYEICVDGMHLYNLLNFQRVLYISKEALVFKSTINKPENKIIFVITQVRFWFLTKYMWKNCPTRLSDMV